MTDDRALDPDEVVCPTCGSDPGVVCRQPSGRRARSIHASRRRAAERGEITLPRAKNVPNPPKAKRELTREDRQKGARISAQNRARRKKEAAALVEQKRAEAEAAALDAEATKLAEDATRFARDRALLRRKTLDAADKATNRLIESLDGLARIQTDEEGKPITEAREEWNRAGDRMVQREVPIVRGWADADTVEKLAKVAASTLNSLRLEEGKPTGIERVEGPTGPAAVLGEAGVDELLAWAGRNLPREEP